MLWCRVIRLGWHGKAHTHNSWGSLPSPALGSRGISLSCLALLYDCASQEIPHRPGLMPSKCCLWEQIPLFLPSSQGVSDPCRLAGVLTQRFLFCFCVSERHLSAGESREQQRSSLAPLGERCASLSRHSWLILYLFEYGFSQKPPLSSLSWLTPSVKWAAFW